MQRLSYQLTVQSDGVVQAMLDTGRKRTQAQGRLNLTSLGTITKDYLPWLETGVQQTRDRIERLGTLLYDLLFTQPVVGHFEERAWREIEERPDHYRLALSLLFQSGMQPEVAALPWELLYCPRGKTFLATDPRVAFSRRLLDESSVPLTLRIDEPLRILLVRLQPRDAPAVALTRIKNVLNELAEQSSRDPRFGQSHPQVSDRGMRNQPRLNKKIDDLNQQWELLNEKLNRLKKQWILETRAEEQLRLEKLIDDTKVHRDQIEEQVKDMESQLAKVGSDAKESTGRNNAQSQQASAGFLPPLPLDNPTPADLQDKLLSYRPHIVHLAVHGEFEERGTAFAFVKSEGQTTRQYWDRSLADLFRSYRPWLVLLQACEGARLSELQHLSQGAAKLAERRIPAVIAMRYPITNDTGWRFAEHFYTRLAAGDDLDVAVQSARCALAMQGQGTDDHADRDFAAPVLWLQPVDYHSPLPEPLPKQDTEETMVDLRIATPDGMSFATTVPTSLHIREVVNALLEYWRPPPNLYREPQRFALRLQTRGSAVLQPTASLAELDLDPSPHFELVAERLDRQAPVALFIEDRQGRRFSTVVLLSTPIDRLAASFLEAAPGQDVTVELVGGPPEAETVRPLRLDATLYDEGISDHAVLRIYRNPEPVQR